MNISDPAAILNSVYRAVVGVERKKLKSTKVAAVRQGSKGAVTTTCVGDTADCDLQAVTLHSHRHTPTNNGGGGGGCDTGGRRRSSVEQAMQRCGICSLISRILRRAMCVGSRRGSGESYYQELAETNVSTECVRQNLPRRRRTQTHKNAIFN